MSNDEVEAFSNDRGLSLGQSATVDENQKVRFVFYVPDLSMAVPSGGEKLLNWAGREEFALIKCLLDKRSFRQV